MNKYLDTLCSDEVINTHGYLVPQTFHSEVKRVELNYPDVPRIVFPLALSHTSALQGLLEQVRHIYYRHQFPFYIFSDRN